MSEENDNPVERSPARDYRWLCLLIVAAWWCWVLSATAGHARDQRLGSLGVLSLSASFGDLRLFPHAQAVVAQGGDPYRPGSQDRLGRVFNYPRIWLTFMRFPDRDAAIHVIGVTFAVLGLGAILLYWGPCRAPLLGAALGALLCAPAIQLGVERGNTDLIIVALVAAGCALGAKKFPGRWIWLGAAVLKLYPILAFGALVGRTARETMRAVGWPLVLFLAYVIGTATDTIAALGNTPGDKWVISYGACVMPSAWSSVCAYHGWSSPSPELLRIGARIAALMFIVLGVILGRRKRTETIHSPSPNPAAHRHYLGFSAATWIFAGTFVAGSNFDYRLIFLLLAVPQLLVWRKVLPRPMSNVGSAALAALVLSVALNFFWAGWPGFWLKQFAGWTLLLSLPWLLAAGEAPTGPTGTPAAGRA